MKLNLVNLPQVESTPFSHSLWAACDRESPDPHVRLLAYVLTIVGQYVNVLRQKGLCNAGIIDDMVAEAVEAISDVVLDQTKSINYVKCATHNRIAKLLLQRFRDEELTLDYERPEREPSPFWSRDFKLDAQDYLNESERLLLTALLAGETVVDICATTGRNYRSVYRELEALRHKLRRYFNG